MKSLELIRKLNEDPALRSENGITVRRLAARIQTLLEIGKLDPDALVCLGDLTVTAAIAREDGEYLFLELDGVTADEKRREELYRLRAVVDTAERVVEAWDRVCADETEAVDFDDAADAAIAEMDALREVLADFKRTEEIEG